MSQLTVNLSGVPETMLWGLYNRATEARRADTRLNDPMAIRIADQIAYDYARSFGKPESGQIVRAVTIDALLKTWIAAHPTGQIVALGEGLETQFYRVDNGQIRWLSLDLPEVSTIRRRFLPDTDRLRNIAYSALDFRWLDEISDPQQPIFVVIAGLLKYFQPADVRRLIAAIAERFPHAEIAFDVIPRLLMQISTRGWFIKTRHYAAPAMPWGLNRDEIPTIKTWHPNIAEVRNVPMIGGRGFLYERVLPLLQLLPALRNHLFSIVHVRCRPSSRSATP
jgi:O-methyltransferase involved in polyketide biosynthesis